MKNEKKDKNILLQDELFLSKYISQNSKHLSKCSWNIRVNIHEFQSLFNFIHSLYKKDMFCSYEPEKWTSHLLRAGRWNPNSGKDNVIVYVSSPSRHAQLWCHQSRCHRLERETDHSSTPMTEIRYSQSMHFGLPVLATSLCSETWPWSGHWLKCLWRGVYPVEVGACCAEPRFAST
jgi:hypothetical protein